MKLIKKVVLPLLLTAALMIACVSSAVAATVAQDGLTLSVVTDHTSYQAGETITATVTLKNEGASAATDVVISVKGPQNYTVSSEEAATKKIRLLQKGASETLTVELSPIDLPSTGDTANFWMYVAMLLVSGAGLSYLVTHPRQAKRVLSLMLALCLGATGVLVPSNAQAAAVTGELHAEQLVKIAGKDDLVSADITYTINVDAVTREEWIRGLLDTLDIDVDSDAVVTFDDYEKAENAKAVQTAINRGILIPDIDRDYVELARPDEVADRDFIAYTAHNALQMHYAGEDEFECNDRSELEHPVASRMAVDMGMISLVDGAFCPDKYVSHAEKETALKAIERLLNSTNVNVDDEDYVNYADGVKELFVPFVQDANSKEVRIPASFAPEGLKVGSVYVLHSMDAAQQDIAIKVKSVSRSNEYVIIKYDQPQLHEVVTGFNLTGSTSSGGYFIPAEGVEVEGIGGPGAHARATTSGNLPLFGAKSIKLVRGDNTFTGTLSIDSLDYRFSASPTWRFPFISIDEVYSALNVSLEVSAARNLADNADTNRVLIGMISAVPLGYGFFVAGPVYADLFSGEVSIELAWGMDAKVGVQYTSSNWIRPVFDIDAHPLTLKLKGELKLGVDAQVNVNFLGITLLAEGAKAGLGGSGELVRGSNMTDNEICLDLAAFVYFTLYTQIGPDGFCKIYETEVLNKNNSIWKEELHFEETGYVEECTRGKGNYNGLVTDAETGEPIYHAKITLYKLFPNIPEEVTFTDGNGVFKGTRQNAGKYKMRITAGGYLPYECTVNIIGGSDTYIEPKMMLSRETTDAGILSGTVSGYITDAMTGNALSNATVSVYNMALPNVGSLVSTTHTNSSGKYSLNLNVGTYEVVFTKDDYIPNGRFLLVVGNVSNFNASLNPENQSSELNSLRAVLHWGSTPADLDSHLVGPQGSGRFHTYFSDKNAANANLDVDIVTGYGPETTTIVKNESGKYSFYVHDYTNRSSTDTSQMSYSNAYIDLYNGNDHLYTIHVPAGRSGTLWHVFDYDGDTRQITLVNSFSYQSSPSAVGISGARARAYDPAKDLKPYAVE